MSDSQTGGFKNLLSAFQSGVDKVQGSLQKSGNSTFYPTTLSVQHSQKRGWLRKQGGVVKSWKRRWFTLKGDQLYYYLTEDETKTPQGAIPLAGNNVVELPFNPSKPDEFIFEIVPGGDKTKMSTTHDTYPICAANDDERKAWMLVVRRIMFSQIGGAIFGQTLEETLLIEHRHRKKRRAAIQKKVPEIVESCVDFLMTHGLEVEGIFRLPGRTSLIRELKDSFDMGKRPQLDPKQHDVQTVASLLKLYLRELPEPIIPCSSYEPVMKIVNRDFHEDPDKSVERLGEEMTKLKGANYNLLQYLCKFLHEIAQHHEVNKMTEINLATVFVHALIRPEDEDPALLMATANGRTQAVFLFINKHTDILKMEYTARGDAVVTDDLLEVEDLLTERKPFNANDLALYSSSVVDSPCGKSMSEEILDLTTDVGNNNLPEPMSPVSRTDPNNLRGSRKGRLYKNYLDKELAIEKPPTEEEGAIFEDDYAIIENVQPPPQPNTQSESWNYTGNHQGLSTCREGGDEEEEEEEEEGGYDVLDGRLCESVSSIEEDYSTLSDYTSDYSALLRKKSSQMYIEGGESTQDDLVRKGVRPSPPALYTDRPGPPLHTDRPSPPPQKEEKPTPPPKIRERPTPPEKPSPELTERSSQSPQKTERASPPLLTTETEKRLSPSPPPQHTTVPLNPENTENTASYCCPPQKPGVDDMYRTIVKQNKKAAPSRREQPDTEYDHIAPPVPPKRPIPNPRHSLTKSVSVDSTDQQSWTENSRQGSTSDIQGDTLESHGSISDYQMLNDIVSEDYSQAPREDLLSHLEMLQNQLFTMREKHKKALKRFAEKLNSERTATQEAVTKVMGLQSEIQKYQLKYGPIE